MENTLEILKKMSESITMMNHENEQLKKVLLDLIGGVSIIDLSGKYTTVNDEYAKTCGYTSNELTGMEWVKTVHVDDLNIAKECYFDMVKNGVSELTFRGVRKNGEVFTKHIILVSKLDINGNLNGHYCFMNEKK